MKEKLEQELAAWKRRLEANKKNNLEAGIKKAQKEIERLNNELSIIEKEEASKNEIKEPEIRIDGKKLIFNKNGIAKLPYNSLLKKVNEKTYIVMYGSSVAQDAEVKFMNEKWQIDCCDLGSHPEFNYDELELAITFAIERMHDLYSELEKKDKKKQPSTEENGEDIEELKRYLVILQEIKSESKSQKAINQINKDIKEVEEIINKNS